MMLLLLFFVHYAHLFCKMFYWEHGATKGGGTSSEGTGEKVTGDRKVYLFEDLRARHLVASI